MRHRSDHQLVARSLAGDTSAIAALVARLECVRRFLAGRVGADGARAAQDLDDLVQGTYLAVWRKLHAYRGDASLDTWVCSFARLELLRARARAARRRESSRPDLEEIPDLTPLARLEAGSERTAAWGLESLRSELSYEDTVSGDAACAVVEHVARLAPPCARVIWLRHVHGLTFDEIAERLSASTSAVKSTYHRGLERLRARALAR